MCSSVWGKLTFMLSLPIHEHIISLDIFNFLFISFISIFNCSILIPLMFLKFLHNYFISFVEFVNDMHFYLFIKLHWLLVWQAGSLVAAHQLFSCGMQTHSCVMQTLSCGMHVGSISLPRGRNSTPCIGSTSLIHYATKKV